MSKFTWHGKDDDRTGIVFAKLDTDGRPTSPARLVKADDPAADKVVANDEPFVVDHTHPGAHGKWLHDYLCAHDEFEVQSRTVLPANPFRKTLPEHYDTNSH